MKIATDSEALDWTQRNINEAIDPSSLPQHIQSVLQSPQATLNERIAVVTLVMCGLYLCATPLLFFPLGFTDLALAYTVTIVGITYLVGLFQTEASPWVRWAARKAGAIGIVCVSYFTAQDPFDYLYMAMVVVAMIAHSVGWRLWYEDWKQIVYYDLWRRMEAERNDVEGGICTEESFQGLVDEFTPPVSEKHGMAENSA